MPPVFPDDESKTRRASFLNYALLTALALVLCVVPGNLAGGRTPLALNVTNIVVFVLCLILRRWMRQGRIEFASFVLFATGFIIVSTNGAILGTIRAPNTAAYMLLIIMAGLLFDLGGMIVMTVMSSLAVAGLIIAENAGLLARPDYSTTITQWVSYTAFFALTGSLIFSALQSTRQALSRAEKEITERKQTEAEREKLIQELQEALSKVKFLSGMLPICSSCKKVRDDKGYWTQIEAYIRDHSGTEFTHGICPECMKKLYPDFVD